MKNSGLMYSIYIQGEKYYYQAEAVEMDNVQWQRDPVVKLVAPIECYDNGPHLERDEYTISGEVYIPIDKITQIIKWN